ncbi:MAG: hypothetical protein RML72_10320 [Bacteroidia bacterium]|nr:hypothetical protein [Bacteroidia bacterium]
MLITQNALTELGAPYLFLEPEYLNAFNFTSLFLLGISFGIFCFAYQMTCYIQYGHKFPFLALSKYPFLKFSLNNSLIPILFWITYCFCFFHFHEQTLPLSRILFYLSGALLGGIFTSILTLFYFSKKESNILQLLGNRLLAELGNSKAFIREAKKTFQFYGSEIRIDSYLDFDGIQKPKIHAKVQFRNLVKIINQSHTNGLIAELGLFLLLLILGIFQESTIFRIPAGASFMLLFSFMIMLIGAIIYWFQRIGPLIIPLLLIVFYILNQNTWLIGPHHAFGLDYTRKPVPYTPKTLQRLIDTISVRQDSLQTIALLENWKKRWQKKYGNNQKPLLILLNVSGGGTRAAVWSVACIQQLEKELKGKFLEQTVLITGASGGMIGAAYYRDLLLRAQQQNIPISELYKAEVIDKIAKDLLNPVVFNFTTNLLLPFQQFYEGGFRYNKDRGYIFENQLIENTGAFINMRLKDYRQAEKDALIPMQIFTPTIANDGRKLIISSQPVSYLCRPFQFNAYYANEIAAVEHAKLFQEHSGENLKITTALRMNATFPLVLPFVELPTQPKIEVLDAGVNDNFGVHTSIKFLEVFDTWIKQNTRGTLIVQIRDSPREKNAPPTPPATLAEQILGILGSTYQSFAANKDLLNDEILEYAKKWHAHPLEVVDLQYIPANQFQGASLSFRLTAREKKDILNALHNPINVGARNYIKQLIESPSL